MAGWQCKAPGGGSGQARSRRRAAPPSCARRDPRGPRTARTPRRRSRSGRSPRRGPGGRTGPGRGSTCRTGGGSGRSGRPTARRSPLLLVLLVLLLLAVVLATAAASEPAQPGEVDLGSGPGGLLGRGGDQAQVVDAGLGVHPAVGDLPGPGGDQVVELLEGLDAVVDGFGQERLPDVAVQPFLLTPPLRRVWFRMHQADA